ncbi:beta-lactamase [Pseudohyphozyma bogoriensis]|nr:beta-lactamase [Pseudohyphozyma bogoriensis]
MLALLLWGLLPLSAALQLPFFTPPSSPESTKPLLSANFSSLAESLLKEWGVPGLAVGVIKLSEDPTEPPQIEFRSYGTMGGGRNVTEEAFAAASVARLVEQGHFNWTSKVSEILPPFKLMDEYANKMVTVVDALSHQTGLPRHDSAYQVGESHEELVRRLRYLRPSAELREAWQYNNQMYATAGFMTPYFLKGTRYTHHVISAIFEPLNMTDTTFTPHLDPESLPLLSSSFFTLENLSYVEIPYGFNFTRHHVQAMAGAGGVVSNTKDLMKWLEFLITQRSVAMTPNANHPRPEFNDIVSPASVLKLSSAYSIMTTEPAYPETSTVTYGMGLSTFHYQGVEVIRHGGSLPGFGTQIAWSSDKRVGVAALCNTMGTGNVVSDVIAFKALEELIGLESIDWDARFRGESIKKKEEEATSQSLLATAMTPEQPHPATSFPLSRLLGRYFDPGYGNITICSPATLNSTPSCAALNDEINRALPITPVPPAASLLVLRPGYFGASHIALLQLNASEPLKFKGVGGYIYGPAGEREDEVLGYGWSDGLMDWEFVEKEEGRLAVQVSGIWGPGAEIMLRERKEGRQVEVAFRKVDGKGHWGMD